MKEPWMIQIQIEDKEAKVFSASDLKRKLKGSGVEVDMLYEPVKVAPGRFVGRGSATERAERRLRGAAPPSIVLFKELRFDDAS